MNDEGVGRQSGRSRQVGSRHRRPLACHLVGNCTQLTTKSQPTNLRHSGIPSPKFLHESRAGRFLGSNKSISWHQPCGQWVCVGVVQSCVRHFYASAHARAVSSGTCQPSYMFMYSIVLDTCTYSSYISYKSTFLFS